ncbi:sugar ABC transporter [Micromonospora qiuiae]|uniref:Sugar ABC transporter n=1 Tax=Micromonospora qiuiae TaxID=502268 RepID=A0ABQ4J8G1_9ACTN|nr:sugar ABC transporter [Micromonospora qiuiae]
MFILVFQAVPLAQEIFLSFTRTTLLNPTESTWVGLDNFVRIFGDEDFHRTLRTTVVYVIACVVGAVGAGLAVALLLNRSFRGRGWARALVTVPWAAPGIAVALIATWMLNPQYGIVNRFLDAIGLGVPGGAILDSPRYALPAILATTIWQLFPFTSVVLLSALQSVPKDLTEAAMVDGAGPWSAFRAVTWPVIRPTVGLLALLMTIWSLRRFELIWLMTKGGPVGATETLVIDLYSQAFDSKELGSAAAIGMVGVVISLIVIAGSRFVARAAEKEDTR